MVLRMIESPQQIVNIKSINDSLSAGITAGLWRVRALPNISISVILVVFLVCLQGAKGVRASGKSCPPPQTLNIKNSPTNTCHEFLASLTFLQGSIQCGLEKDGVIDGHFLRLAPMPPPPPRVHVRPPQGHRWFQGAL